MVEAATTAATTRSPSPLPSAEVASLSSLHDEKKVSLDSSPSTSSPTSPPPSYPEGAKFYLLFGSILTSIILVALDQTIVSTAVPEVTNQFKTFSDVGWYGSAYLLTSTCFQPLFGRLYARFPIKWVFMIAFTLFEVGSLICGVAQDSTTFIVGRAIAGLGMSGA